MSAAGSWRHAKWCLWERGAENGACDCGLDAYRRADSLGKAILGAARDHRPRRLVVMTEEDFVSLHVGEQR